MNTNSINRGTSRGWTVAALMPLALLASWVLAAPTALGCSVPVFRYALERWPTAPYDLLVLHRGNLSDAQQALVTRLAESPADTNRPANLNVQTIDLTSHPPPGALEWFQKQPSQTLPALVLRYPQGEAAQGVLWSGPLDAATVDQVLDSPLRRKIIQRLVQGDCAVWVFLESGDPARDQPAFQLLRERLASLEKTLELPTLEAEDLAGRDPAQAQGALRVVFSLLRLARNDPAEHVFIRMLLHSEEDMAASKEPMAFPIFGRGRLLFGLVGQGINADNIEEACSFVIGPCSCIIKEQNPGLDLLIAAAWDDLITARISSDTPLPELTGLANFQPGSPSAPAPAAIPLSRENNRTVPSSNRMLRLAFFVLTGIGALALIGGVLALRRGKEGATPPR